MVRFRFGLVDPDMLQSSIAGLRGEGPVGNLVVDNVTDSDRTSGGKGELTDGQSLKMKSLSNPGGGKSLRASIVERLKD